MVPPTESEKMPLAELLLTTVRVLVGVPLLLSVMVTALNGRMVLVSATVCPATAPLITGGTMTLRSVPPLPSAAR